MILIFSNSYDSSTHKVLEWLSYKREKYIFITEFNCIKNINISITTEYEKIIFDVGADQINLHDIKSVWFRRENIFFKCDYDKSVYPPEFKQQFDLFIKAESYILKEYLFKKLAEKCFINKRQDEEINKLYVLSIAASIGIKIPFSTINMSLNPLLASTELITKPISETIAFYYDKYMCKILTQEVNVADNLSNFPTLVQIKADKLFEVRSFFLNGDFYSIALFSQQNTHTKIDYRNYDYSKPTRSVPFCLPQLLEDKCRQLMKLLDLACGSIDFIYNIKGEFIFLEVNPVGQFENVSAYGNYFLEQKIAAILSDEANN
jgi:ATP-GRASP peptide maturase of grasp-with-spasm system